MCLFYPSLLLGIRKLYLSFYAHKTHTHTHTIRYVNNCKVTVPAERHYFGLNIPGVSSLSPSDQGIRSHQYKVLVFDIWYQISGIPKHSKPKKKNSLAVHQLYRSGNRKWLTTTATHMETREAPTHINAGLHK